MSWTAILVGLGAGVFFGLVAVIVQGFEKRLRSFDERLDRIEERLRL